jgi:predicted MPP superfamily phosphohydrolase
MLRFCERTLAMAAHPLRLAIVGDVHDDWNAIQDAKALQFLEPDLVLFTGDFGEENVELVRDISNLDFPKAVILGNHDAWWSTYNLQLGPSEGERDGVQAQLDL